MDDFGLGNTSSIVESMKESERKAKRKESLKKAQATYRFNNLLNGFKQITLIVPIENVDQFRATAKKARELHKQRIEEARIKENTFTPEEIEEQRRLDEEAESEYLNNQR